MCTFFHQKLITALLKSADGREWPYKIFHDQSPRKNVADPAGVEPATSWSPVGSKSNWAIEVLKGLKIIILLDIVYKCPRPKDLLYTYGKTKFVQMMTANEPLTFLWQGQICIPMHLYGENVEKSFSQNILKTNGWNLQCVIKVVKYFSYNQNFVPWGLSALATGLYTCIKLCNF